MEWFHPQDRGTRWARFGQGALYAGLYLLTALPLALLYVLADVAFVLLYYVLRYRRRVVDENLRRAFPEKSDAARATIRRRFYRHLANLLVETLKLQAFPQAELVRRAPVAGADMLRELASRGQSVIIVSGHYGNWEWSGPRLAAEPGLHTLYGVYKRLRSVAFDRVLYHMRGRTGMQLMEYADTMRTVVNTRGQGPIAYCLIADQTPAMDQGHWVRFLNQDTNFFLGPAKLARKFNYPVVFVGSRPLRRGRYEVWAELLVPDPQAWSQEAITERFAARMQALIEQDPAYWLWSHKRWKHPIPPGQTSAVLPPLAAVNASAAGSVQ